jgi:site-specific recombinase XerD
LLQKPDTQPAVVRHTYATFRLSEGVDAYLLAEQMGTSVQMIQQHYGHVAI